MNVLVTDGNQRAALAITRSLGRRGATVIVGEESEHCLAGSSRYCTRRVTYPSRVVIELLVAKRTSEPRSRSAPIRPAAPGTA